MRGWTGGMPLPPSRPLTSPLPPLVSLLPSGAARASRAQHFPPSLFSSLLPPPVPSSPSSLPLSSLLPPPLLPPPSPSSPPSRPSSPPSLLPCPPPHRCAGGLKKMDQRWGSKCHRLFLELFNVPVQAPKHFPPSLFSSPLPPPVPSSPSSLPLSSLLPPPLLPPPSPSSPPSRPSSPPSLLPCPSPHRCAGGLKKMDQRWGSKCHRLFLELFNVPVQAPKRGQPLKVIPRNCPISVAFYDTHGDR